MTRRMRFPIFIGVLGAAILISLGMWQVQRLDWKQTILADIEAQMLADPVAVIPVSPDPVKDRYLPVTVTGEISGPEIHVLASRKIEGPGFRVITAISVGERRFLLDRGFVSIEAKDTPRPARTQTVIGNLQWPDEIDSFTPDIDSSAGIWFARDVRTMAILLKTEPILIVARSDTGGGVQAHPVDTGDIPNDHLGYAITWFSLAVIWLGMTVSLLWRIKRRTD